MVFGDIVSAEYRNLNVQDLVKSRIPDRCLCSAHVIFTSPTGNEYLAIHIRKRPKNPIIALESKLVQRLDFRNVAAVIAYETGGVWKDNLSGGRASDVSGIITLPGFPRRFTQRDLAEWVSAYQEHFQNVSIDKIGYDKIPRRMMEGTRIDPLKLVT